MVKRPASPPRPRHPLDIALGARIKAVRLSQRPAVTQQWVARELGCTIQQVHKYESGETRVAFSRLCEIAKALDIGVIEMIAPILRPTSGP